MIGNVRPDRYHAQSIVPRLLDSRFSLQRFSIDMPVTSRRCMHNERLGSFKQYGFPGIASEFLALRLVS